MSTGVSCPVLTQDLCEVESHGAVGPLLESGEGAQGGSGLGFADFGEVEVNEGGLESGVTEVG